MRIHKVNIAIDLNSIYVPSSYYVKPKEVNNLWQMDGEKGSASNFNILPEINKSCFLIESDPHLERGS